MTSLTTPATPDGLSLSQTGVDTTGMFRNAFGDPKPATVDQLIEAGDEVGIDFTSSLAVISNGPDEPAPFTGWSADIEMFDEDDNHYMVSTAGFPTREALISTLTQVGINPRDISEW